MKPRLLTIVAHLFLTWLGSATISVILPCENQLIFESFVPMIFQLMTTSGMESKNLPKFLEISQPLILVPTIFRRVSQLLFWALTKPCADLEDSTEGQKMVFLAVQQLCSLAQQKSIKEYHSGLHRMAEGFSAVEMSSAVVKWLLNEHIFHTVSLDLPVG